MPNPNISIPKQPLSYIVDDFKQVLKNNAFCDHDHGIATGELAIDAMDCLISCDSG
jgi:hypothetical protein